MRSSDTCLNLMETLDANDASVGKLFNGEGSPAKSIRSRNARHPEYQRQLVEAARLLADVYSGRRPVYHLKEALGTADFPNLFGDILDRQLLSNYRETPQTYRNYCSISTVP